MSRDTLFGEPYEQKGYNPLSNYHCDNALHGYGCYHLDEPKEPEEHEQLLLPLWPEGLTEEV